MNSDNYFPRDGGRHRDYRSSSRHERDDRYSRGGSGRGSRRRSRSPDPRSGRSRREEAEADSYSMSRSHRDREREDRYSGRDRRSERDWDLDRGTRKRDNRRDDGEGKRGAREPTIDDRRSGRGARDRDHERDRRRSPTPPPQKREPTPDLTDVVPVLERRRRLTQWDIKPPGYENVPAEQAKLSGMFPLPGAPRQQALDPSKLQAFMNQPSEAANSGMLKPTNSRQAKRLILANIPPTATEEFIVSFFNLHLNNLNVIDTADPCILCQISADKTLAMVEFKHSFQATVALAFDGIFMHADEPQNGNDAANGSSAGLIIRRPKDYIVPAVINEPPFEHGVVSNVVNDSLHKISISNLPTYLDDEQVKELLVSFGELKAFVLVKDRSNDESSGIAFCEYIYQNVTDAAIQGLDGMNLGDKKLKVRKASAGITQVSGIEMGVNAMSMLAGTTAIGSEASRVLQLLNMVTPEELMDQEDYEGICEDVTDECSKFGTILEYKIPRAVSGSRQSPGVGKIFVKYDSPDSAAKALRALAGRKFADRTVVTTYFSEENFDVGAW